jgi:hypothetical protein
MKTSPFAHLLGVNLPGFRSLGDKAATLGKPPAPPHAQRSHPCRHSAMHGKPHNRAAKARTNAPRAIPMASLAESLRAPPIEGTGALSPALNRAARILAHGLRVQGVTEGPALFAFMVAFGSNMSAEAAIEAIEAIPRPAARTGAERLRDYVIENAEARARHAAAPPPSAEDLAQMVIRASQAAEAPPHDVDVLAGQVIAAGACLSRPSDSRSMASRSVRVVSVKPG